MSDAVVTGSATALHEVPLFPLRTVLFPSGKLPLRIFEPRYLDMISRCMREDQPFGVLLIRAGADARSSKEDQQPDVFSIGTLARIIDFNQLNDGLLGIVGQGGRKFSLQESREQADHLLLGEVRVLPDEPQAAIKEQHADLVAILRELVEHPMVQKLKLEIDFEDARSVSWRLAELLPVEPEIKQSLLQLQTPWERMTELTRLVSKLRG